MVIEFSETDNGPKSILAIPNHQDRESQRWRKM